MDLNLIDLGGFTEKDQQVIENTGEKYVSRTQFDHQLIIVLEVQKKDQQVKLQSNFEWEQVGDKWRPNVSKANDNFVDPVARK